MTAAIALFAFGAVTAALSLQLPLGTLRMPGSGFFPLALGLLLAGLAAAQAIRAYLARPGPAAAPAAPESDGATRRVVLFMGATALAIALLPYLGYALVGFLLMLALLQVLGMRRVPSVLVALGSAVACYFIFVQWLRIPLPEGWLGF